MTDKRTEMAGLAHRREEPARPSPPVRPVQAAPAAGKGGPGKGAALSERERITALETAWQYLATKEDLANTEGRLLAAMAEDGHGRGQGGAEGGAEDIAEVKEDLAKVRLEIAGLKLWMLGAVFGGNATLLGLAALLYRLFVA